MKRPWHTIILLPHGRIGSREYRFTTRRLIVTGLALVAVFGIATWSLWTLVQRPRDPTELARVRQENTALRRINASFEASLEELQARVAEFEARTRELAIVAGVEDLAGEAGVGGALEPAASAHPVTAIDALAKRADRVTGALATISGRLDEQLSWLAAAPTVAPVRGVITSGYGYRSDPITGRRAFHPAVDIGSSAGNPVQAPGDGVVVHAGRLGELGNAVVLSHGFGITTRYGHLSQVDVTPGQRIDRGTVIGQIGRSGRTTGYHLHYEVRVDRRPVDPFGYLLDR
ncbi:MAG: peptidoglycan DD-metalloendopeptidase family protein [Thermoanaerobaculia bacterium]